jgi:hypothetical protein
MQVSYEPLPLPPEHLAPVLDWDDLWEYVLTDAERGWLQDQHVGLVGPTDQGKSNLAYHLLGLRKYVTYFAIKTDDATLDAYAERGGYARLRDWPPKRGWPVRREVTAQEMPRRLLWPDATQLDSEAEQTRVFSKALRDIYADGRWCPVFDDYWYLAHILGFERTTKKFLANARSNLIPMVVCAQRPAGNRLVELFDQTTHLFFFRDNDEPNLKRISGVGWLSADAIRGFVANLEQYQFLYVNTRTGWMYRSRAPKLDLTLAA